MTSTTAPPATVTLNPLPRFGLARAALRLHRRPLIIALVILSAAVLAMLVSGLVMHAEPAALRPRVDGMYESTQAGRSANGLTGLLVALSFVPILLGAFMGASVVSRDLGTGTARFAWAQGAGRVRWVTATLITIGGALALAATLAAFVFAWWAAPYTAGRLDDPLFGLYPPVFAGWTVAAFALAALLGAVAGSGTARTALVTSVMAVIVAAINASYVRNMDYLPAVRGPQASMPAGSIQVGEYFRQLTSHPLPGPVWHRRLDHLLGRMNVRETPAWLVRQPPFAS